MKSILIKLFLITVFIWPVCISEASMETVSLRWLDGDAPPRANGVSWGVPWPKGVVSMNQTFTLTCSQGRELPIQTWPLAYWPDGSLKWCGFATVVDSNTISPLKLKPDSSTPIKGDPIVQVKESDEAIEIDTRKLQCRILRKGDCIIESMAVDGHVVAREGRLVCVLQHGPDGDVDDSPPREKFVSQVNQVTVEQHGSVRAVIRIQGVHKSEQGDRAWLPFNVRLYFYAGQVPVRVVHTIIFDGDQEKDFIRGLGLVFSVPMREQLHNRHVRFSGEGSGLWAEPIKLLTGRRTLMIDGHNVYPDQLAGKRVPNREEYNRRGQNLINDWAVWNDYKLIQSTADGFTIHKRTNPQSCWLDAGAGRRASGLAFVGDVTGGLAVGVKDFWQSYPSALEIRDAATETAELWIWLWSPDAPAMDLRHYDIKAHGLEASYENVQEGFSTAHGIARTSEIMLYPSAGVPSGEDLVKAAKVSNQPPLLVCTPEYLHSVQPFGIWSLPDSSTPGKRWIEEQLDNAIDFYKLEVEQRHWYGFWDYGDIMHAYDPVRHTWRYDIGGYAWDNSELVPDMWLWYSFLRTGRADIFRMAEAMTRHTGEVDMYHLGWLAGLGSRHNVRHWGCGAKEARISQAALRRFYYYLTTDERVGDLMHEVADSDRTFLKIDPLRIAMPVSKYPTQQPARLRIGPDWLALIGNWMTEWERTGNTEYRDKIVAGIDCLAQMPYGLFSGPGVVGYDPNTGKLYNEGPAESKHTSHLVMIMGGAEVCFELTELIDHDGWDKIWMQYCELYTQGKDGVGGGGFSNWHARLTAYAGKTKEDPVLVQRAWREFLDRRTRRARYVPKRIEGPNVLNPIDEVSTIETNGTAQWCLNAIELLELIGDKMPENSPLWDE